MQLAAHFRMMPTSPSNSSISLPVGFFSTPLTDLNLEYNQIGKEGAIAIARALPK